MVSVLEIPLYYHLFTRSLNVALTILLDSSLSLKRASFILSEAWRRTIRQLSLKNFAGKSSFYSSPYVLLLFSLSIEMSLMAATKLALAKKRVDDIKNGTANNPALEKKVRIFNIF